MLTAFVLTLISFVVNSIFLTIYFSALLLEGLSKRTIHIDAVKIALPGTILLSIFALLTPLLPPLTLSGPLSSWIDIGISAAAILWVILTRHYCETSLLGAIMITVVALIVCILVIAFVDKFLLLVVESGTLP